MSIETDQQHSRSTDAQPNFSVEVVSANRGPVMLMIHGMLSSRRQWERNKAALAGLVQPVLIDLWGHGESPAPDDLDLYSVDGLIESIDRIREQLGAPKIVLCTQSFGAGLGLHYCLRYPERVIAHIFTNSMSALSQPADFDATRNREKRIRLIREQGRAGLAQMPFHPSNARRLDPQVKQILVEAANAVSPDAFIRLTGRTRPDLSAIDQLHKIRNPTLLVNGRWEKGFQPLRDEVAKVLPGLKIVDIEAGHAVNLEQSDAFNDAVLKFLTGILPITD